MIDLTKNQVGKVMELMCPFCSGELQEVHVVDIRLNEMSLSYC